MTINNFDETTSSILLELEKTQKDFWNISRSTANFLNLLIKASNLKSGLEIGCSNGYSGIWQSKAFKENGGHFTTIEYYDKRLDVAKENFEKCNVADVITTKQGSACEILENFKNDDKFDYVFIDANKREYVKYFELIKPHLLPNAIIAADNITSHAEKVQTFVDAINTDDDFQVEILDLPAGLLLARKRS